jgi:hypothetical protein
MSDSREEKVFQIKDMGEFISSVQTECVRDVLDGVSVTFHGKVGGFSSLLHDSCVVNSFLPKSIVEREIKKYVFSTTLHADEKFISPHHMEMVIHDLSSDIFDLVMLKLVDFNLLELCWHNNDFLWRVKSDKMV